MRRGLPQSRRPLLPVALLPLAILPACAGGDGAGVDASLIHAVARGDVQITVRERAEIKAAKDTRVSSELEGRATLIYLIPEGTVVQGGDKVAELDVSLIVEKRAQQAITVVKAKALLEQARKNVEIVEKELRTAERTAETRLEVAQLRLRKFLGQRRGTTSSDVLDGLEPGTAQAQARTGTNEEMIVELREVLGAGAEGAAAAPGSELIGRVLETLGPEENLGLEMGEMANQILRQIDEISLARAELELANQTLFYSRKLAEKGFITANELERDEIDHQRQQSNQTVVWNNLLLLVSYTLPETLLTLALEVENSELNRESVRATNDARRVREDAELKSIEAEFALAEGQLATWERQIANGVLHAPAPGLVVYGRQDWDEPVYEGMEVRERQEVIILPDIASMMADIRVPESQIGKLAVGQRASVQIDAFPSQVFTGHVTRVSSLPEAGPRSQVLKVYIASVLIDGTNADGALRPGMNGTVTVEVGTIPDVLNVPMPAVERHGDGHFVWKVTPDGPLATPVALGANNLTHVEVVSGLAERDRIYLVRPPGARLPAGAEQGSEAPAEEPDPEVAAGPG